MLKDGERLLSYLDFHPHEGTLPLPTNSNTTTLPVPKKWTLIHIPKTAGDSFMTNCKDHMPNGTTLFGNKENALLATHSNLQQDNLPPMVILLRDPTSHVLSQFLECKYDRWGKHVTNNTSFPGYHQLDNVMAGFDEWIGHFVELASSWNHNESVIAAYTDLNAYRCYDPYNMQSRYLTSHARLPNSHFAFTRSDRWPDIQLARHNLEYIQVVGIVEHFPASLCLFEFHAGGEQFLSHQCQTCDWDKDDDEEVGGTLEAAKVLATVKKQTHGVPPHTQADIAEETLAWVNNMTTVDQQLYETALARFYHDIDRVQEATGVDLLCRPRHYPVDDDNNNDGLPVVVPDVIAFTLIFLYGFCFVCRRRRDGPRPQDSKEDESDRVSLNAAGAANQVRKEA